MQPYIYLSADWGEFYLALNRGAGNSMIGMFFEFSKKKQMLLSAWQATLVSWSLHWLVSVLLAMVVFRVNLNRRTSSGNLFALMLVFFDYCFRGLGMPYMIYYFSPVSLCNLDLLDLTNTTSRPSMLYAYSLLVLVVAVLALSIRYKDMKRQANISL